MKFILDARPRIPFGRDAWVIKKRNTYFGMHVPRLLQPSLTETWLFMFDKKKIATDFALTLSKVEKETGQTPHRVMEDCHYCNWRCKDESFDLSRKDCVKYIDPYQVSRVNVDKLMTLASLEGFTVRRVILNGLGDFVTLPHKETREVSAQQIALHLDKVYRKQFSKVQ